MSDPDKTFDFRWTDGTIMMWAMWTNGQPNHAGGLKPYGSIYSNRFYNDAPINIEYKGLCEKSGKWNLDFYLKQQLFCLFSTIVCFYKDKHVIKLMSIAEGLQ